MKVFEADRGMEKGEVRRYGDGDGGAGGKDL